MADTRVFLSWSGTQGREIAGYLKRFLSDVLQIDVFMSDQDIAGGDDWATAVRDALIDTHFGIVVLTPANLFSPWLHYEFGAMRAAHERRCLPLLFGGVTQAHVTGPFQQAQARVFAREHLLRVIGEMHTSLCASSYPLADAERRFGVHWDDLERGVDEALGCPEDSPLVQHTQVKPLPPTLERLRANWERLGGPTHGDFKLYTFCGMHEDSLSTGLDADEDLELVYYLWADAEHESSITAHIRRGDGDGSHLRVRFDNGPMSAPSNVAIRPSGTVHRRPIPPAETFTELSFEVRVPADREPTDLEDVQLALRIIDGLTTHWEHRKREGYHPHLVRGAGAEWQRIAIPLERSTWGVFPADGNWLYRAERPDFTGVLAVVVELGSVTGARPSHGRGVVELRNFALSSE